jgi:hypothetical protein
MLDTERDALVAEVDHKTEGEQVLRLTLSQAVQAAASRDTREAVLVEEIGRSATLHAQVLWGYRELPPLLSQSPPTSRALLACATLAVPAHASTARAYAMVGSDSRTCGSGHGAHFCPCQRTAPVHPAHFSVVCQRVRRTVWPAVWRMSF